MSDAKLNVKRIWCFLFHWDCRQLGYLGWKCLKCGQLWWVR